jgi:hypothetical protein
VYGISHPLRSFNPVWAQVQPLVGLWQAARRAPSMREAVRFFLASPSWHPDWLGPKTPVRGVDPEALPKYDVAPGRGRTVYVFVQLAVLVIVAFALLSFGGQLSSELLAAAVAWVLLSLVAGSALLAGRRWAVGLEVFRVGAVGVAIAAVLLVPRVAPVLHAMLQ